MRISDWSSDVCSSDLEQALRDEQQRALAEEPEHLTDADREAIRQLAQNIPALWSAASTTPRDRQTIARMLLERVEVLVLGETEHAELTCHWSGGVVTKHAFIRPVRRFEQLEHFDKLLARITQLRTHGATAQSIADILNTERSEEHTSELQSLMRISYAVFCLKKKTKKINIGNHAKYTSIN